MVMKLLFWSLVLIILFVILVVFTKDAFAIPKTIGSEQMTFQQAFIRPRIMLPKKGKSKMFTITAYTRGDGSGEYTADGTRVSFGVAACPYSLKFGAKFKVPSLYKDKIFTCHDRSAFREGLIDLWVPTMREALQVGRQKLQIVFIK